MSQNFEVAIFRLKHCLHFVSEEHYVSYRILKSTCNSVNNKNKVKSILLLL